MARTRALSEHHARTCEEALGPVCRCRCGGAMHGSARGSQAEGCDPKDVPRSFFEELPDDDPHHVSTVEETRERNRARHKERYKARKQRLQGYLPGV